MGIGRAGRAQAAINAEGKKKIKIASSVCQSSQTTPAATLTKPGSISASVSGFYEYASTSESISKLPHSCLWVIERMMISPLPPPPLLLQGSTFNLIIRFGVSDARQRCFPSAKKTALGGCALFLDFESNTRAD